MKKITSVFGSFVLALMFFGVNVQAEYDGTRMDRTGYTDTTNRVNDMEMNRVNNDVRTRNVNTTNDVTTNHNRGFNWAWLGLFGLLGLLGLRKHEKDPR